MVENMLRAVLLVLFLVRLHGVEREEGVESFKDFRVVTSGSGAAFLEQFKRTTTSYEGYDDDFYYVSAALPEKLAPREIVYRVARAALTRAQIEQALRDQPREETPQQMPMIREYRQWKEAARPRPGFPER